VLALEPCLAAVWQAGRQAGRQAGQGALACLRMRRGADELWPRMAMGVVWARHKLGGPHSRTRWMPAPSLALAAAKKEKEKERLRGQWKHLMN